MSSIFLVGSDAQVGQELLAQLNDESLKVVTDHFEGTPSDSLQRGHLLDQMRRFGPFDHLVLCLPSCDAQIDLDPYHAAIVAIARPLLSVNTAVELWPEWSGHCYVVVEDQASSESAAGILQQSMVRHGIDILSELHADLNMTILKWPTDRARLITLLR